MYKIDDVTARQDFAGMCEAFDLDIEGAGDDSKSQHELIIEHIRKGNIVINEDLTPTYTPVRTANVAPITFREATGATLLAADKYKDAQKMHKLYAMLTDLCELQPGVLAKLKASDLKVITALGSLFLG